MYKIGDVVEGTIIRVYPRYAIVLFENGETGLLHISELSNKFIADIEKVLPVGTILKVKIIDIDTNNGSIRVSKKQLTDTERHSYFKKRRVPKSEINFDGLSSKLQGWITEENSNSDNNN